MTNNNIDSSSLKDFLQIPYDKLEELNLKAKEKSQTLSPAALRKSTQHI